MTHQAISKEDLSMTYEEHIDKYRQGKVLLGMETYSIKPLMFAMKTAALPKGERFAIKLWHKVSLLSFFCAIPAAILVSWSLSHKILLAAGMLIFGTMCHSANKKTAAEFLMKKCVEDPYVYESCRALGFLSWKNQ